MVDSRLAQIVEIVQQNPNKFSLLYPYIEKKVYFWCFTITKNTTEAEDMLQEAMLAIHKGLPYLNNPACFNSWLYQIVTRCCYNYIRTVKKKDNRFLNYDDFSDDYIATVSDTHTDSSPKEIYDLNELKEIISTFIENLPRKQREAITLFYLEEFKINEIADILDCDANNVKARLHKGRKNLESQISEYQEKHNIKLYGVPFLTLITPSLSSYQEAIYKNKKSTYVIQKQSFFQQFMQTITTSLITKGIILSLIICCCIAFYYISQQDIVDSKNEVSYIPIVKQKDGYDWILSVAYDKNLTRYHVPITFTIHDSITKEEIKVWQDNKEIPFTYNKQEVLIEAIQNGTYKIQVRDETLDVVIDTIDKKAPELIQVYNHQEYLLLDIDDTYQQIDYKTSYIEYHGKQYPLHNNKQVSGIFTGTITVVLITTNGQSLQYTLNIT